MERVTVSGGTLEAHPWMPDCWLLRGGGDLEAMPAFQEGLFQVQDAAARAAVLAAGPRPGGPGAGRVRRAGGQSLRRRHGDGGRG